METKLSKPICTSAVKSGQREDLPVIENYYSLVQYTFWAIPENQLIVCWAREAASLSLKGCLGSNQVESLVHFEPIRQ